MLKDIIIPIGYNRSKIGSKNRHVQKNIFKFIRKLILCEVWFRVPKYRSLLAPWSIGHIWILSFSSQSDKLMVFFIWIIIRSHGTNMLRNILCMFLIWSCRFFFYSNNDYRKLYEDGTHTIESKNMFHVSKCPLKSCNNKVMDWHGKNAVNLQIANYMAINNRLHH